MDTISPECFFCYKYTVSDNFKCQIHRPIRAQHSYHAKVGIASLDNRMVTTLILP